MVLARSLATTQSIGSNTRGEASGAGWTYALPTLSYDVVLCVPAPPVRSLRALARIGTTVIVAEPGRRRRGRLQRAAAAAGWANVAVLDTGAVIEHLPPRGVDLLVIGRTPGRAGRRLVERVVDRLAPGAVVYSEAEPPMPAVQQGSRRVTTELRRTPSMGEVRSLVASGDRDLQVAVRRMGLEGTVSGRPKLARWERRVRGHSTSARPARISVPVDAQGSVPAYLHDAGARAGVDLTGWRAAVCARGDYDTQKVLVLLAPPAGHVEMVVKITRSAEHGDRLRNEAELLRRLETLPVEDGRVPRVVFDGEEAGRVLVAESHLAGTPLSRKTLTTDAFSSVVDWVTDLGAVTCEPVGATEVSTALLAMLTRLETVYPLTKAEATGLRDAFVAADAPGGVPLVLQHGDPGLWNVLVRPDGRAALLDWEAGEPDGLPLWDVFYLFRSYAQLRSGSRSPREHLDAASSVFLSDGPDARLLANKTGQYCERLGLDRSLVTPLLLGCWVHRALKDANRLGPKALRSGLSYALLRRLLENTERGALHQMSSASR